MVVPSNDSPTSFQGNRMGPEGMAITILCDHLKLETDVLKQTATSEQPQLTAMTGMGNSEAQ